MSYPDLCVSKFNKKTLKARGTHTAVHGCHCPGDMAVRIREVLSRPWVGVCVLLDFKFVLVGRSIE